MRFFNLHTRRMTIEFIIISVINKDKIIIPKKWIEILKKKI